MWAAIDDLHARRIGHGIRAIEDTRLLGALVERRIPLEMCPSSNVCTRVVPSIDAHPIKRFMDAGAVVTVNTDDPHMFGTNLDEEYRRVAHTFGLSTEAIVSLARNAIEAAMMPSDMKRQLLADIDAVAVDPRKVVRAPP